jgi:hypothetical protein
MKQRRKILKKVHRLRVLSEYVINMTTNSNLCIEELDGWASGQRLLEEHFRTRPKTRQ